MILSRKSLGIRLTKKVGQAIMETVFQIDQPDSGEKERKQERFAMVSRKEELLKQLETCVLEMEDEQVSQVAEDYISEGFNAYEGIMDGLCSGMEKAGQLYEEGEYFIPEIVGCSDAMYAGMDVLRPHIRVDKAEKQAAIVIGVVEGDTHDIGKNLVKTMLEATGYDVYDLGKDVPPRAFVDKAKEVGAKIVGLSTLMATTMDRMEVVVKLLEEAGIRDQLKIMIGGGPVSQKYANEIGADYYTSNASEAAELVKKILAQEDR